ncbi:MAG: ubiquinol-cytochrome C chaperone family protein [Hyphomicrobiaceae bacterium]
MFGLFRRRDPHRLAATELYGSVVAQARHPYFYLHLGVPDTKEGRFELLVLHLSLLIERLRTGEAGQQDPLAESVTACFVDDIHDSYREMGLSDTKVPQLVKKAAGALFDRTLFYRDAAAGETEGGLDLAFTETVLAGIEAAEMRSEQLARYYRAATQALTNAPLDDIRKGAIAFPDPATIMT